jgi:hypothetical protein
VCRYKSGTDPSRHRASLDGTPQHQPARQRADEDIRPGRTQFVNNRRRMPLAGRARPAVPSRAAPGAPRGRALLQWDEARCRVRAGLGGPTGGSVATGGVQQAVDDSEATLERADGPP